MGKGVGQKGADRKGSEGSQQIINGYGTGQWINVRG